MQSLLIVGSGLAGLSAARAARDLEFTGPITVLGDEPHLPYDRPPLSKEYLAGVGERTALDLMPGDDPLHDDITWVSGRTATALHPGTDGTPHEVVLDDGTSLRADGIVIATGSRARGPADAGIDAPGTLSNVHTLRTLDDADRLRASIRPGARLLIVGAGLIGSEIACTARELGADVTVVTLEDIPMTHLFGPELAPAVAAWHERHGVRLLTGRRITDVDLDGDELRAVELDDGTRLELDAALVSIGGTPAIGWLADSGLDLGDGVRCDEAGRSSVPGIVAVGDCAAWYSPVLGRHHRGQHWHDALDRPADAVAALLGVPSPRRRPYLPYFWSDQYGERIQMAGYSSLADRVEVLDGDPATGGFLALYSRREDPVAVLSVSRPREFVKWRKTLTAAFAPPPAPTGEEQP